MNASIASLVSLSLLGLLVGCGSSSGQTATTTTPPGEATPLPSDPIDAYSSLGNDCGTFAVAHTPILADPYSDHPFVTEDAREQTLSRFVRDGAGAKWSPMFTASSWSALHAAQSTQMDVRGNSQRVETCNALADLVTAFRSEAQSDGSRLERRAYLVHHVDAVPGPKTVEDATTAPIVASAMRSELVTVDYRSEATTRPLERAYEEIARASIPLRIACTKPLELAPTWRTVSDDVLAASDESPAMCRSVSEGTSQCLTFTPRETLDGCTFVGESVSGTTESGRAVRFSFGGTLKRVTSSDGDAFYELRVDKSRAE